MYTLTKQGLHEEFDYIDQDGASWDSPSSWLWVGILGGCACGSGEELGQKAVAVLATYDGKADARKVDIYDDPAMEVIAHWMDASGLIEHGTSIRFGWLTPKGLEVYAAIKTLDTEV